MKHSTVDYVFKHDLAHLYEYHCLVMDEMVARDFGVDPKWYNRLYRGTTLGMTTLGSTRTYVYHSPESAMIYPEHDDRYLRECLENLKAKGAELVNGATVESMLLDLDIRAPV